MDLFKFVSAVVQQNSMGLTHGEIVSQILQMGYVHEGGQNLSQAVHDELKILVRNGSISRKVESTVRTYKKRAANQKLAALCVGD